jgi:hypothetical protein
MSTQEWRRQLAHQGDAHPGEQPHRRAVVARAKLTDEENTLEIARNQDLITEEQYQIQLANIYAVYDNARTKQHDEELKKRYNIANVYHELDMQSAGYFFGQMAAMMNSHNRAAFEIGKISAKGKAIIDAFGAANGAYNALASIPYVGPVLGAAAAAAALVAGMANVAAINAQKFGGGEAAIPVFPASPTTGLPVAPTLTAPLGRSHGAQACRAQRRARHDAAGGAYHLHRRHR